MMEIIKSDRLILRKPKTSDAVSLLSLLNDDKIAIYTPHLSFNSINEIKRFLHYYVRPCDYKHDFCFVIQDLITKDIVGIIDSYQFLASSLENHIAVSYAAKKSTRGRGIIPEALKLFLLHLHNNSNVKFAEFSIREDNLASLRVMEKLNIIPYEKIGNYIYYNISLQEKPSF